MKKVALGVAVLLLSTAAYAQTSTQTDTSTTTQSSSGASDTILRNQARSRTEVTGSTRDRSVGTETNVRTRIDGGARIGVETREDRGVAVHRRTVREIEEPTVSVSRRRSVTTYEEPAEPVRTVIKKKPTKKVVVKKKKPATKVVLKKRRYHVVEEPVEVRRRSTVRRYEVDEPSVSVNRRTTIRQTREVNPDVGVSVEQRRTGIRSSSDVNVSTTRQRSNGPDTTGSVSTRSRTDTTSSPNLRLQQGGSSSSESASQ